MGLYGMTSGQALGQGTFTFDRIVPNRYLLDSRVNNDSVMPGRYALIEYDRPIAVIKNVELILNTENKYELPESFKFEYNVNSKETYNQFPVNNEKSYDIIPVNENGKISMAATAIFKIFICIQTPGQETTYNYFYANIPEQSSEQSPILLTKTDFILYEPDAPYEGEEEYKPLTPNKFNKIVDRAYIAKDEADDIDSNAFDLWDSTAWIKIIDKEKSEFKYIKIADLNVLTPSFNVLDFDDEVSEPLPIHTFHFEGDNQIIFNAPQYKPSDEQRGAFNVRYPYPLDLNMQVDIDYSEDEGTSSWVESQYQEDDEVDGEGHIKLFTLHLPIIGKTVNDMDSTTLAAQDVIGDTLDVKAVTESAYNNAFNLIKYPRSSTQIWPTTGNIPTQSEIVNNNLPSGAGPIWEAIKAAYTASSSDQAGLISRIGTDGITVSIGNQTGITNGKLNIEVTVNSNNLITASKINEMWN